jgi:hypothetical protein
VKLLLDEQIDVRLKTILSGLDVYTPVDLGWQGLKNGVLSEKLTENGFSFFVTADKNLPFQQNLDKLSFIVIVLDTPTLLWEHQSLFAPKIQTFVADFNPDPFLRIVHISLAEFQKGKKLAQFQRVFRSEQIRFI